MDLLAQGRKSLECNSEHAEGPSRIDIKGGCKKVPALSCLGRANMSLNITQFNVSAKYDLVILQFNVSKGSDVIVHPDRTQYVAPFKRMCVVNHFLHWL